MTIQTRPCFYYDFEVTASSVAIDFDEGGPELLATLRAGLYTFEGIATEIARAMNSVGIYNYQTATDRQNRVITISEENSNIFSLNFSSGTRTSVTAAPIISFSTSDFSGASSYTGTIGIGKIFEPQFPLQKYVDNSDYQESVSATRNESSSGIVEICRFGTREFIEFNITYQTNSLIKKRPQAIEYNPTGKDDLVDFMRWVTRVGGIELMKDRKDKTLYTNLLIERTPISSNGTGYKLKELYNRGLPEFFETGVLKFRVTNVANC